MVAVLVVVWREIWFAPSPVARCDANPRGHWAGLPFVAGWHQAACCLSSPRSDCNIKTNISRRCLPAPLQFGGPWFNTHPLDGREWAVCVGLGATTLGLRELLRRLPYGR
jgi:hypothetical protein